MEVLSSAKIILMFNSLAREIIFSNVFGVTSPCESIEEGFCWYVPEAGLYHFTIDRDNIDNPGPYAQEIEAMLRARLGEPLSPKVGEVFNSSIRMDHNRACRFRIRYEGKVCASITLPRNPNPVSDDHINVASIKCN